MKRVLSFLKRDDGPTAVEYAVILALIVVVVLAAITTWRQHSELTNATPVSGFTIGEKSVRIDYTDGTTKTFVSREAKEGEIQVKHIGLNGTSYVALTHQDDAREVFVRPKLKKE